MKKNSAIAHEAVGYLVCVPILCCCVCTLNGMSSTYCVILQFCVCVYSLVLEHPFLLVQCARICMVEAIRYK